MNNGAVIRQELTERTMKDNPKFERPFLLLDKAEKLARLFTGGYSNQFFADQEFHVAYVAVPMLNEKLVVCQCFTRRY